MERQKENLRERAAGSTSNVFSLAVAVGLIIFLIAGAWGGGLTGIQGFFVGLSVILLPFILLFILSETLSKHKARSFEQSIHRSSESEDVSVSHSQSEGRIIINVYVNKSLVGSHKVDNV